jgi:hypothetical protein
MDENFSKLSFLELLYGPLLSGYFEAVRRTNPSGFGEDVTPLKGVWEAYVYESVPLDPQRFAAKRIVRDNFVKALIHLGGYLRELEDVNSDRGKEILSRIAFDNVNPEHLEHFNMFFNIVSSNKTYMEKEYDGDKKVSKGITIAQYQQLADKSDHRVNIRKLKIAPSDYTKKLVGKMQKGGAIDKLPLLMYYIPLYVSDDLSFMLEKVVNKILVQRYKPHVAEQNLTNDMQVAAVSGTEVGGGRIHVGGGDDEIENIKMGLMRHLLTISLRDDFVKFDDIPPLILGEQGEGEGDEVVSAEDIAKWLACNQENTKPVQTSSLPMLSLPKNKWIKLSDGSYKQQKLDGSYEILTSEECQKLLNNACAGSGITNPQLCQEFMKAVNEQNASEIINMLSNGDDGVWGAAADSMDKLHPETVLRILRALRFGTKSTPLGKQVCSVDDWLAACQKDSSLSGTIGIKPNMKKYLEVLVQFANSNPSIFDESKQPFSATTSGLPKDYETAGFFNASQNYVSKDNAGLDWNTLKDALAVGCGQTMIPNLSRVQIFPTHAYGSMRQVGGQKGGNVSLFYQPATAKLCLSNGINQLLEQSILALQSTPNRLTDADVTKLREKMQNLTQCEQEIYRTIEQLNQLRLAHECGGLNCSDQIRSQESRLMQLGNVYDRRVPCLQELCEQLRCLLAQNQSKNSYEQL